MNHTTASEPSTFDVIAFLNNLPPTGEAAAAAFEYQVAIRQEAYSAISSYEDAEQFLWQYADTSNRLGYIVSLYGDLGLSDDQLFTLLGEHWTGFDTIYRHSDDIRDVVEGYECPIVGMMTPEELHRWNALPETLVVYRGCSKRFPGGLCWSLDPEVAAKFPFLFRHLADDPVIITAEVRREDVFAVKLDREESEVITTRARFLSMKPLIKAI